MREIRTSGSMSGDGKRGVAERPKLPRPSSTLPSRQFAATQHFCRFWGKADIERGSQSRIMSTRPILDLFA
jgi:hypothetical protein